MDQTLIDKARAALGERIARNEEALREYSFMAALDETRSLGYGVQTRSSHRERIAKIDRELTIDRHVLAALSGVERVVDPNNGSHEQAVCAAYTKGRQ